MFGEGFDDPRTPPPTASDRSDPATSALSPPPTRTNDADLAWYDDLLRAGRSEPERVPWYRRIFSRSPRDRDESTRSRTRRSSRRQAGTAAAPTTGTTSSHSAGPGTLSTVMGLVVASGLAVTVAPGSAEDVGPRPEEAVEVTAPSGDDTATAVPGAVGESESETTSNPAPGRVAVPDAPPRAPDEPTPSASATDGVTEDQPWVAVVDRLDVDEFSRDEAEERSMTLTILGVASEAVASEDLGEEPGSWVLVTGPFGTADQAVASCADRDAAEVCEPVRRPG